MRLLCLREHWRLHDVSTSIGLFLLGWCMMYPIRFRQINPFWPIMFLCIPMYVNSSAGIQLLSIHPSFRRSPHVQISSPYTLTSFDIDWMCYNSPSKKRYLALDRYPTLMKGPSLGNFFELPVHSPFDVVATRPVAKVVDPVTCPSWRPTGNELASTATRFLEVAHKHNKTWTTVRQPW